MTTFWIIAILLFSLIAFVITRLSLKYYRKDSGEKMWKQFGIRTRYWQVIALVSFILAAGIMLALKWLNILSY